MSAIILSETLNKLLFEKKIRPIDLARAIAVPQPTIHRLIAGKSPHPHRSTLEPIAKFFNISVEQLKGEDPLYFSPGASNFINVPLLDWSGLDTIQERSHHADKHIIAHHVSKNCFATQLLDSSMEPQFSKGCILIFDPSKQPNDRNYILVKLSENNIFIFRQLLIDGENKFLKPLNPDLNTFKMRLLGENDTIIANLIETRQLYE